MRAMLLCVAVACVAFAPAPLPRRGKAQGDDLRLWQGEWVRESDSTHIRVTNDLVQFPSKEDAWRIKLDQSSTPRRIDFFHQRDDKNAYLGVYRIEGDTLTYCVKATRDEAQRPSKFENGNGGWLQVYRRKR